MGSFIKMFAALFAYALAGFLIGGEIDWSSYDFSRQLRLVWWRVPNQGCVARFPLEG
jgi:hypothetical protein